MENDSKQQQQGRRLSSLRSLGHVGTFPSIARKSIADMAGRAAATKNTRNSNVSQFLRNFDKADEDKTDGDGLIGKSLKRSQTRTSLTGDTLPMFTQDGIATKTEAKRPLLRRRTTRRFGKRMLRQLSFLGFGDSSADGVKEQDEALKVIDEERQKRVGLLINT